FSAGLKPTSPESEVMQDADRLDALGAIGIMRTVSCGVRMSASYYNQEEPIARGRPLDDKRFTIDHFFVKLLKLADAMNTKYGKEEARRRVEFMHQFLRQFETETEFSWPMDLPN
ncbi:MAG: hydrolase, partial [Bdellovibrionales bacterium]|nr:hydrolase [Bdellovibrionales bacterium]